MLKTLTMRLISALALVVSVLPVNVHAACNSIGTLTGGGCLPYIGATANLNMGSTGLIINFNGVGSDTTDLGNNLLDFHADGLITSDSASFIVRWGSAGDLTADQSVGNRLVFDGHGLLQYSGSVLAIPNCPRLGTDGEGMVICMPDPMLPTGDSTADQKQQNTFNGFVVFFATMFLTIWIFKKR